MATKVEPKKFLKVNRTLAKRVLNVVDKGLTVGMGDPMPGSMCVEAAVVYAMGLPHDDEPPCVSYAVRVLKIQLNDSDGWKDDMARAKGLRALAIAQLGSNTLKDYDFLKRLLPLARTLDGKFSDDDKKGQKVREYERQLDVLKELQAEGGAGTQGQIQDQIDRCIAILGRMMPYLPEQRDLLLFARGVTRVLVAMKSPGTEFMDLLEA